MVSLSLPTVSEAYYGGRFPPSNKPILLDDLACTDQSKLVQCPHDPTSYDCSNDNEAGVRCYVKGTSTYSVHTQLTFTRSPWKISYWSLYFNFPEKNRCSSKMFLIRSCKSYFNTLCMCLEIKLPENSIVYKKIQKFSKSHFLDLLSKCCKPLYRILFMHATRYF